MSRLKILHVVRLYYPVVGGNELLVKELSEALSQLGEDITIFTTDVLHESQFYGFEKKETFLPRVEIINGLTVRRYSINYKLRKFLFKLIPKICRGRRVLDWILGDLSEPLFNGPLVVQLIWEIIRFKPDIVMGSNLWGVQALYCLIAKKIVKFPLILLPCIHVGQEWVYNPFVCRILKSADHILALTDLEKDFLVKQGVPKEIISVVGVGINPQKIKVCDQSLFRKKYGLSDELIVTFVGRKLPYKGIDILVEAMKIVWGSFPGARLVLAGECLPGSSYVKDIIQSVEMVHREKIINIDNFDDAEKSQILSACDVFAMPSSAESFGIVYLEAWLCEKPVIGCDNLAPADVITHGEDGLLVSCGDIEGLAKAILALLRDEDMRINFGKKGREKVLRKYTWDIVARDVRSKYYDCINRP